MDKCVNNREQVIQVFRFMPTLKEEEVTLFKDNVAVGGNSKLYVASAAYQTSLYFGQSKQAVWHEVRFETQYKSKSY